jgi:hypothetical protein
VARSEKLLLKTLDMPAACYGIREREAEKNRAVARLAWEGSKGTGETSGEVA